MKKFKQKDNSAHRKATQPEQEHASPDRQTENSLSRRKVLQGLTAVAGAGFFSGGGLGTVASSQTAPDILLVVGDGQGPNQLKAGRGLKAYRDGSSGFNASLQVDRHAESGQATTTNASGGITDSAAAATAMSTGFKTKNGVIGGVIDSSGRFVPKETVLERAKKAGYKTGLVTTSALTDATPAAFGAHTASRSNQTEIARQYIRETGVDVLLGGGKKYFSSTLRDQAKAAGYNYVTTASGLAGLSGAGKTLGLFATDSMGGTISRSNSATSQPNMDLLVKKARQRLGTGKSFLLIENEHIDTYGHSNWAGLPHDVLELDTAGTKQALDAADGSTLVITTGDHETGGLSFTASPKFNVVDSLVASDTTLRNRLAQVDGDTALIRAVVADGTGISDLTTLEIESLKANSGNIRRIVANRAGLRWSTTQHTKTKVPVFATGPSASSLQGEKTLTDIAKVMRSVVS
ncbi:alkaline phosphatase [Haloarcula sp. S1AR25-5A]|uniref:Alkaline phosphatase n=1 Tax=Haloarcula terrestris TaxID=2950533 RepID=A0AAE4JHJ1_9EURY|nr:alkaline phosphatase [Haloarcula terrestris]MDS0222543.1 alkaline phosphatase [Haloarcula terrestris]